MARVLGVLNEAEKKATASYVKQKLGWTWSKTKTLLLELAAADRINAEETTYGWVFWSKEAQIPPEIAA